MEEDSRGAAGSDSPRRTSPGGSLFKWPQRSLFWLPFPYGPELLGLAVPRRGHGPGRQVGQLDCERGPLRGIAEHLERLCLAHHARPGRQVGQAPQVPLLLGRDHVAAVFRSARPTSRAVTVPRAGRAAEHLQRLAIFIQRRRIDEQHLSGVFTPQNLHAHLVCPSRIPLATRGATGTVVPPAPGRGEWWSGWGGGPAGRTGHVCGRTVRSGPHRPRYSDPAHPRGRLTRVAGGCYVMGPTNSRAGRRTFASSAGPYRSSTLRFRVSCASVDAAGRHVPRCPPCRSTGPSGRAAGCPGLPAGTAFPWAASFGNASP